MPKVSVIVPVYNVERYLGRCLDSLVRQTMKDIEIICVNDGSSDGSKKILKQYGAKDKRITIVTKKNGGLSDARNAGMRVAKGRYFMFCDSDDWYEPNMCLVMYEAITDSGADMAACGLRVVYESQHHMKESDDNYYRVRAAGKQRINADLVRGADVAACNKIYRRSIIEKYDIRFPVGLNYEDAFFFNAYAAASRDIYYIKDKLYNYVRRDGSIMSETFGGDPRAIEHVRVAFALYDFLTKNGLYEGYREIFWEEFVEYYWFARKWVPKATRGELRRISGEFVREHRADTRDLKGDVKRQLSFIARPLKRVYAAPMNVARTIYGKSMPSYRRAGYVLEVERDVLRELGEIEAVIDRLARLG